MEKKVTNLSNEELHQLRREIVLCSVFLSDYENTLGINREEVYSFFDGYADYLEELMIEDGHTDAEYIDLLKDYDNQLNLEAWRDCVECGEYDTDN